MTSLLFYFFENSNLDYKDLRKCLMAKYGVSYSEFAKQLRNFIIEKNKKYLELK